MLIGEGIEVIDAGTLKISRIARGNRKIMTPGRSGKKTIRSRHRLEK
jgi:hypothetical protein